MVGCAVARGVGIGRGRPRSIAYTEEGIGLGLLREGSRREEGRMVRAGRTRTSTPFSDFFPMTHGREHQCTLHGSWKINFP